MATKHYSKRFLAGIQRVYLLVVPLMLLCIMFANNYLYDSYYEIVIARPFRQRVAQLQYQWRQQGRVPQVPDVRYRALPPGTAPYAYFTDWYADPDVEQRTTVGIISYTATMARGAERIEVTVSRSEENGGAPGAGMVLFSVGASLVLFLLLSWLLFQFSIKRLSYNLWLPFYQNLRRINGFSLRDRQRLALMPSEIREFGFFNAAITHFTDKIQQSYNELREFTENTAHELQTPLAVLLAKTELVLKRNQLAEADRQELVEIKKTVQRLSSLQKALNLLSRVRTLQYGGRLAVETIDVLEHLRERLVSYAELLDYKDVRVDWHVSQPWYLHTNRELLGILLDNLVRNAIQHNVPGGFIRIECAATGVVICNAGLSPASAETDLFQRYHTRSTDDGRLGLGLALVEATCDVLQLQCTYYYQEGTHAFTLGNNKPATSTRA
ncbi:HAMP domain-containing histidine kinase [Hymenobacter aerilatus]|uniref:histidine kinase n=1 Tax=Hymenobacter aerilatus TaxID=2932251 RepID=A0A8T9T0B7_9BACT|nr:HAMP domain-containing sensor histidine kinase [Hymenobacter aerilatus]UOR05546.1 HAMP domain-containing histidine kinase [Hymenobacter aerilatus]